MGNRRTVGWKQMASSGCDPAEPGRRRVTIRLQHRQVCFGEPEEKRSKISYAGLLITNYEFGVKVTETWLPLGVDPSEADDEELIQKLRDALLWQAEESRGER
jgi:hypothetical protein